MYKGNMYSVTFDKKPTQKEAIQAMAEKLDKVQEKHKSMTFQAAAEEYIESKRNVLSPSTIRGYMGIIRQIPEIFLLTNVHDITALDVQDEDIRRILEYAKGTEYEIPLILACYGLRRSEICALTTEDINGDILSITKAKVQGKNNE